MYCIPELCFLLCIIPLIKATGIKIDGQIDLGENWNYEYRVFRTQDKNLQTQNDETASQMQKVDLLNTGEERLQNVSPHLRQDEAEDDGFIITKHNFLYTRSNTIQSDKRTEGPAFHKPKAVLNNKSLKLSEYSDISSSSDESNSYTDSDYASDLENDTNKKKRKTNAVDKKTTERILRLSIRDYRNDDDSDDESSDSDSSESTTKRRETETTTEVDKKILIANKNKHIYPLSGKKDEDWSAKDSVPNILDYNIHTDPKGSKIKTNHTKKTHDFNKEALGPPITTTIRTTFIYNETFMVKENQKIINFYNYVFNETRKIFDEVNRKTDQDHIKTLTDKLERSYKAKFNEFHHDTAKQKVKTRLGTQKVILNSIETSTIFVNRLLNHLLSDISWTGHNAGTAKSLREMVEKAEERQLVHACKTFGICRSKALFSEFLSKVLEIILSYDDDKFKRTIDAFTEELKDADSSALGPKARYNLKYIIDTYEKGDVIHAKAVVAILKNTIANRNKPIIVKPSRSRIVNSTLALLEIIDLLDAKIDGEAAIAEKWTTTKVKFTDFGVGIVNDIQPIVRSFVEHMKQNINTLDKPSREILLKHTITALHFN